MNSNFFRTIERIPLQLATEKNADIAFFYDTYIHIKGTLTMTLSTFMVLLLAS